MRYFNLSKFKKPNFDPYWAFNPSQHYKSKVDKSEFYNLTGFDFGWLVLEPLSIFVKQAEYEIERGKALSYGQKALYYWWYLDAQVTNGGFIQFYYNDYGKYVPTIMKSLQYIGDNQMVTRVKKADNIYQKNKNLFIESKKTDLFESDLYEKLEILSNLDDEYLDLRDETMAKIEEYFKTHLDEVVFVKNKLP